MLPQDELSHKATPPRLLADAMLGRLARWLRLMGYDTTYWRNGSDMALIEQARAQGRLIVTRDRQLAGRRGADAILVTSETLDEQIVEVRAWLAARPGSPVPSADPTATGRTGGAERGIMRARGRPEPFSRCPECNGELDDLPHETARDLVPPYVWHTQFEFHRCPDCGRVYWKGTHWPAMQARLAERHDE